MIDWYIWQVPYYFPRINGPNVLAEGYCKSVIYEVFYLWIDLWVIGCLQAIRAWNECRSLCQVRNDPVYLHPSQASETSVRDSRKGRSFACAAYTCIPPTQKKNGEKCILKGSYLFQSTVEANCWTVLLLPVSYYPGANNKSNSQQRTFAVKMDIFELLLQRLFKYFIMSEHSLLMKTP